MKLRFYAQSAIVVVIVIVIIFCFVYSGRSANSTEVVFKMDDCHSQEHEANNWKDSHHYGCRLR
jgi:hypothetical protein